MRALRWALRCMVLRSLRHCTAAITRSIPSDIRSTDLSPWPADPLPLLRARVSTYPTLPTSAEIKYERFFEGQEGRRLERTIVPVTTAQALRPQGQVTPIVTGAGAAVPTAWEHTPRRPASRYRQPRLSTQYLLPRRKCQRY